MLQTHKQGQGPLLVLLHGWASRQEIWQPLIQPLMAHFTVMTIDLPGFGECAACDHFTLPLIAEQVLSQVPAPAIWCGWSLGGLIALYLASHFPEQVRGVITVATNPQFIATSSWPGMPLAVFQQFIQNLTANPKACLLRFMQLQCHGLENSLSLRQIRLALQNQFHLPATSVLLESLQVLGETDFRKQVSEMVCPQLAILGAQDAIVPVAVQESLSQLSDYIDIAVINGAAHLPFLSHQHHFLSLIEQFYENKIATI